KPDIPKEPEKPFVRLLQNESIDSRMLNNAISYKVLLPESYAISKDSFPVVYLLHGFGDNQSAWLSDGLIQYYADKDSAANGQMIFVMPQGFNSYYVNRYNGSYPYMNFFSYELVPEIDRIYRTKKNPQYRAVMGYSMGGYGALILPAMHPEVFSIGVPLSMSFRTDEQYLAETQSNFNSQWGSIFGGGGLAGQGRLTDYFKLLSPFYFFGQNDLSRYSSLKFLMDCGDDEESLHITNGSLHNLMRDRKIPHEFRVRNGGHNWQYWHGALPEALQFISCGFSGKSYPENPKAVSFGNQIASTQYSLEDLSGSDIKLGIFKPADYSLNSNSYPVIFWMHDFSNGVRTENATKILSFLNNSMVAGTIPNSIIVEIPEASTEITSEVLTRIIMQINTNYRLVADKKGKVFMGNEQGGRSVCNLIPGLQSVFNGLFLFNAKLLSKTQVIPGTYYYVDVTDKSDFYQSNFDLFVDIRNNGNTYEYRVRQGTASLQSTINGLNQSLFYLSHKLKAL
ncbi:MAG: alpha/beta hydrolase-fold protein, partial [Mariniphaga sp.]